MNQHTVSLKGRLQLALCRLQAIPRTEPLVSDIQAQARADLSAAVVRAEKMAELMETLNSGMNAGGLLGALHAMASLYEARAAKAGKAVH